MGRFCHQYQHRLKDHLWIHRHLHLIHHHQHKEVCLVPRIHHRLHQNSRSWVHLVRFELEFQLHHCQYQDLRDHHYYHYHRHHHRRHLVCDHQDSSYLLCHHHFDMVWYFQKRMDLVDLLFPQDCRVLPGFHHQIHHYHQYHNQDMFHPYHHLLLSGVLVLLLMMEVRMCHLTLSLHLGTLT